jgi:hypothetical protein
MTREEAENILGLFLLEDVCNNRNFYEDTHDITYVGQHFAVRDRNTGEIETFKVILVPSDLPANEWLGEFNRQEWLEE